MALGIRFIKVQNCEKVKAAFSNYRHVIFLRYSEDVAESLDALRKRHPDIPKEVYDALNQEFIESSCNENLATHIINTKNKTIQDVVDLALERIHSA